MRFNEEKIVNAGLERAIKYFCTRINDNDRKTADAFVRRIVGEIGPVVREYPVWHPLARPFVKLGGPVSFAKPEGSNFCDSLEHVVYFEHGFIACPIGERKAREVVKAVDELTAQREWDCRADMLDVHL